MIFFLTLSPPFQECTVYVENLAKDTTHESLKAKFVEFGPVAYVSIPKFKNNRIKGFAFVEFESKETVRKVLDSYVTPSEIAPASLLRKRDRMEHKENKNGLPFNVNPFVIYSCLSCNCLQCLLVFTSVKTYIEENEGSEHGKENEKSSHKRHDFSPLKTLFLSHKRRAFSRINVMTFSLFRALLTKDVLPVYFIW